MEASGPQDLVALESQSQKDDPIERLLGTGDISEYEPQVDPNWEARAVKLSQSCHAGVISAMNGREKEEYCELILDMARRRKKPKPKLSIMVPVPVKSHNHSEEIAVPFATFADRF